MTELVIFDCDGVLVDSEPVAARVLGEALRGLGLAHTDREVDRRFRGRSIRDIIEEVQTELGAPLPEDFVTRLNEETRRAFDSSLEAVAGVESALADLAGRGLDLCVASSGTPEKIRHSLDLTGLGHYFEDRLFSALSVKKGKPAPDLFLHAARAMGHPIDRSVVIEDSLPGIRGALEAGARVLAYVAPDLPDRDAHVSAVLSLGAEVVVEMQSLPDHIDASA